MLTLTVLSVKMDTSWITLPIIFRMTLDQTVYWKQIVSLVNLDIISKPTQCQIYLLETLA